MITVQVQINGNTVFSRSAVRVELLEDNHGRYEIDEGSILTHDRDDGAVELAKKLLDTVDEPGNSSIESDEEFVITEKGRRLAEKLLEEDIDG